MVGIGAAGHHLGALLHHAAIAGAARDHVELQVALAHGFELLGILITVLNAVASAHALGAAAVVSKKQDQRVVILAGGLEGIHHAAHAGIHVGHHGGVSFHEAQFPCLVLGVGPRGCLAVARRIFPFRIDQPHLQLARIPLLAHGVPALVVKALVGGDLLFGGMHRPMRRGIGHVQEERLIALVFLDVTHGVVADGVGVIILVGLVPCISERRHLGVLTRERVGIKETTCTVDGPVETVKTALAGPVVFWPLRFYMRRDVPFTGHVGGVAGRFHHLRNGAYILAEIAFKAGQILIAHHPANARLMRVHASE